MRKTLAFQSHTLTNTLSHIQLILAKLGIRFANRIPVLGQMHEFWRIWIGTTVDQHSDADRQARRPVLL